MRMYQMTCQIGRMTILNERQCNPNKTNYEIYKTEYSNCPYKGNRRHIQLMLQLTKLGHLGKCCARRM